MEYIISSVKHMPDPRENEYYAAELHAQIPRLRRIKSRNVLQLGEVVELEGEAVSARPVGKALNKDYMAIVSTAAQKSLNKGSLRGSKKLASITAALKPKLTELAKVLISKCMLGVPIIIRFHNDADGLGGAYAIYKAMQKFFPKMHLDAPPIIWRMHRGVFYEEEDAENDILCINEYESVAKPLLMIIDFGTSVGSNKGIEKAAKHFDIVWLDHHPIESGFKGAKFAYYVNPWNFGGDSNYTAGYLAARLAHLIAEVDTIAIEEASLIGDYSIFAEPDETSKELAMLFDLVTSDTHIINVSDNISPEEVDKILNDERKRKELLSYAKSRLSESIDIALKSVKQYKSKDMNVYVVDFSRVRGDNKDKYPLPGRFASKLLEHIENMNGKPCILILHFGLYISIRASKQLRSAGILEKVRSMENNYSAIVSAGGHSTALSIKLNDEDSKAVIIKALLRSLGCSV